MATEGPPTFCATEHECTTCADEGVEVRVLAVDRDGLADCADPRGVRGSVDTALIDGVVPGDALLVHAGVALTRLSREGR